ncbi:thiamine pyrophosphate-dependent enzyme [Cellulomonas sp. P22]|uniref:thiamine pyrophosphate-dependent enzyme n=1 Tax=Cellulomonas sp. P22 TaxID=3373189 RepID=UPI0037B91F42
MTDPVERVDRLSTVADQLVAQIVAAGARHVYGMVGDSLNPVVDAVFRANQQGADLSWVHVRHEETAAFAAFAEATLTGRLAVCAGSAGPGSVHLVNGLYDANRSRVPVLAIASQIVSGEIGTEYFQATHPDRVFGDCTVYRELIATAAQAPRVIRSAIHHAYGAPGVALLTLPGDVSDLPVPDAPRVLAPLVRPTVVPDPTQVHALAAAIDAAAKVTIFAGAGVAGAHDEVVRLAGVLAAPVGHTLRGKEWIQHDNPFDVGMTGSLGYGALHDALFGADLVLMLGTDFPFDAYLPPDVRTAQVDVDPTRMGRRTRLDLGVVGDVGTTVRGLLELVAPKSDRSFLMEMLSSHERTKTSMIGSAQAEVEEGDPVRPEHAVSVLDQEAPDDALFTVDTGLNCWWAARYLTPNGRRRIIGSFHHGSMANAVPHAIGAAFAQRDDGLPQRHVVALSGDGGLSMLLGELITLAHHGLPVKVVVTDNATLGYVRLEMQIEGRPVVATDSPPVDYAAIARAVGIPATRVTSASELRPALREAFSHDGPALVDIATDPGALPVDQRAPGDSGHTALS